MASVKDIIEINISRETRGVSRAGFGTPLFIGETVGVLSTTDRIRTYSSAEAVLEDFADTDPEYTAAQRFFGQQIQPTFIKIGFRDADAATPETITEAYTAIKAADDDFYFVTAQTREAVDVEALAGTVETESRIFGTSTSSALALDAADTTDIGSVLQALNYAKTFVIYAEDETQFPECAIIGLQAPKDPGSTTWKFKTVTGVNASNLTTTQSLTLKGSKFDYGKGYNTIEPTGGRDIFAEGRMVNSEFIDIIRFSHWLEARMRERIYLTLVNSEKIPFTNAGFAIIEGRMREVLNNGVAVGGILPNYEVVVPNARTLDPNERANRVASGFSFRATLQGAVHYVSISGTLQI